MVNPGLSVREIRQEDIDPLVHYWFSADDAFLIAMGVDLAKMPTRDEFVAMLTEQLNTPLREKKSYCIIWLLDGVAVGHSNINKIVFGEEAYMHLHMWNGGTRQQGLGTEFVKLTLPYFFGNLELKKLYSEPYALNPAPNRTLAKAGFDFVKQHITTPGSLNFEQPVNLWEITSDKYSLVTHKM